MKEYDFIEIQNIINKENIRFVGICMTAWHLQGAKACFEYIKDKDNEIKPIYLITRHPETGYCISDNEKELILYYKNRNYKMSDSIKLIFSVFCDLFQLKDHAIYIASPFFANIKLRYDLWGIHANNTFFFIFEEGVLSYDKKCYSLRSAYQKYRLSKHLFMFVTNMVFTKVLGISGRVIHFLPFKYIDGHFCENQIVINFYKRICTLKSMNKQQMTSILFLTQENQDEYNRFYVDIVNLLTNLGLKVYLKPHPRLPIDKSLFPNIEIIDKVCAIEELYPELMCKYVLSINSTSLLTLKYLYGATTISLIDFINNKGDLKIDVDEYVLQLFDKRVLLPKNEMELRQMLK